MLGGPAESTVTTCAIWLAAVLQYLRSAILRPVSHLLTDLELSSHILPGHHPWSNLTTHPRVRLLGIRGTLAHRGASVELTLIDARGPPPIGQ